MPIRDKAQDLLWPENQDEARWSEVIDRMAEQAGMPWLPPKGLETLKSIACNRGLWEDLGNGYVTKKPKKKKTSVQVIARIRAGRRWHRAPPHQSAERRPCAAHLLCGGRPGVRIKPAAQGPTLSTKALRVHFPGRWTRRVNMRPATRSLGPTSSCCAIELYEEKGHAQGRTLRRTTGHHPLHARWQRAARRNAYAKPVAHRRRRSALARVRRGRAASKPRTEFRFPSEGQERPSRSTT